MNFLRKLMLKTVWEKELQSKDIVHSYAIADDIFLIGSFEPGVTIYKQQVRAHNLAWAMSQEFDKSAPHAFAVVGGGITGLTLCACLLSVFENATVTIFESRSDLCPLQQGADHRWIHPHIYSWPDIGSRRPSAALPILNWETSRASDVVHNILAEFRTCVQNFGPERVKVRLGVQHLRIEVKETRIQWVGYSAESNKGFFKASEAVGSTDEFGKIVVSAGFGLEMSPSEFETQSYWRSDQHSQPLLGNAKNRYLISGAGDGALIDLCRLTIERFRQDTILDELFASELEEVENKLCLDKATEMEGHKLLAYFHSLQTGVLKGAAEQLGVRIRKDTRVWLYLGGADASNRDLTSAFMRRSSFLNRLLLFLLYRCGAFVPSFGILNELVGQFDIPSGNVICRHGAHTMDHICSLFVNKTDVESSLSRLKNNAAQIPNLMFPVGYFPTR